MLLARKARASESKLVVEVVLVTAQQVHLLHVCMHAAHTHTSCKVCFGRTKADGGPHMKKIYYVHAMPWSFTCERERNLENWGKESERESTNVKRETVCVNINIIDDGMFYI